MKKIATTFIALSLLGANVAVPAAEAQPAKQAEAARPDAKPTAVQAAKSPAATDRVELDTTQITGNRELPRVLYVVPWKRPDLGDPSGKPPRSLLDEVLAPVDRDVFQRQNRYHDALQPDTAAAKVTISGDEPKVER